MTIKAIETRYRGYRFRSRLEARWAVFFSSLKLNWQYEPEGFILSDGTHYLPDFLITLPRKHRLWVEVKPDNESTEKFNAFMNELKDGSWGVVLGQIPEIRSDAYGFLGVGEYNCLFAENDKYYVEEDDEFYVKGASSDWPYEFCICTHCGTAGFEFSGRSERISCCEAGKEDHKVYTPDHWRIRKALMEARSARFEHGECPV
jgi:hypothetical protein